MFDLLSPILSFVLQNLPVSFTATAGISFFLGGWAHAYVLKRDPERLARIHAEVNKKFDLLNKAVAKK